MRAVAWLLGILGALAVLAVAGYYGYGLYIQHVVANSPATMPVIHTEQGEVRLGLYEGGDQIVPTREGEAPTPTLSPTPAAPTATAAALAKADQAPTAPVFATPPPDRPILPPARLQIAKIGLDVPVVLADYDNTPKFKAAGWYVGSGYPGFRGNMVLFGPLAGEYQIFARLAELAPGDRVTVHSTERAYNYVVSESQVVPADAVEVLLPTRDYRLTLITSAGTYFADAKNYSHRLVVIALLDR